MEMQLLDLCVSFVVLCRIHILSPFPMIIRSESGEALISHSVSQSSSASLLCALDSVSSILSSSPHPQFSCHSSAVSQKYKLYRSLAKPYAIYHMNYILRGHFRNLTLLLFGKEGRFQLQFAVQYCTAISITVDMLAPG